MLSWLLRRRTRRKVRGVVRGHDFLTTPWTETKAVYYRYEQYRWFVGHNVAYNPTDGTWRLAGQEEEACEFYVETPEETFLVDPTGARFEFSASTWMQTESGNRTIEYTLSPGARVTVIGNPHVLPDPHNEHLHFRTHRDITVLSSDKRPLIVRVTHP